MPRGKTVKKGHVQRMRIQQTEMSLERTSMRRRCQEKEMSRKRGEKRKNWEEEYQEQETAKERDETRQTCQEVVFFKALVISHTSYTHILSFALLVFNLWNFHRHLARVPLVCTYPIHLLKPIYQRIRIGSNQNWIVNTNNPKYPKIYCSMSFFWLNPSWGNQPPPGISDSHLDLQSDGRRRTVIGVAS